jgi:hypothetical protein
MAVLTVQNRIVLEKALLALHDNTQDELSTKRGIKGEEQAVEDCCHTLLNIHEIVGALNLQLFK